jgi:hypothetical protein
MKNRFVLWALAGVATSVSFCSCSALRGNFSSGSALSPTQEEANRAQFLTFMRKNDSRAKRFAPLVWDRSSAELRAQYFLQTCQWRNAFGVAQSLPEDRRAVYLAILTALTSVRRPPKEEAAVQLPAGTLWIYPATKGEIWRDEWSELNVGEMCSSLGQEGTGYDPERLAELSRWYFSQVSPADWKRDFNIVALALDVHATIPHPEALLQHYEAFLDSPYYLQLQQSVPRPAPAVSVVQRGSSVRLGSLSFSQVERKTHELGVPWLVEAPWVL